MSLVAALALGTLPTLAQQPAGRVPGCTSPSPTSPGSNGPNPFGDPCKTGPSSVVNPALSSPWLTGWPANTHINDLATAYNHAVRQNKLLFVIFGADWCNYCKAMKNESFADARIVKLLSENVMVVLDVEKDDQHNNTKQLMNRLSVKEFPAFALVQIAGTNPGMVGRVIGYHDKEQFYNVLYQLHPSELIQGKERPNPAAGKNSPLPRASAPAK